MPTEFTLLELAKLADVTPRTVRYYIAQGLLPSPTSSGPGARYTDDHLERLRAIKKLQSAHMPLSEIRALLRRGDSPVLYSTADRAPSEPGPGSAADYISDVLQRRAFARAVSAAPLVAPSVPAPASGRAPAPTGVPGPDRGTWERIELHPDIELHVRRPSSRLQNKRVERLISIARQLLEEE